MQRFSNAMWQAACAGTDSSGIVATLVYESEWAMDAIFREVGNGSLLVF